MKKMLFLCPVRYDLRELVGRYQDSYFLIFYSYDKKKYKPIVCNGIGILTDDFDPRYVIDEIVEICQRERVEGILSSEDYPGSVLANIVAKILDFPGPDVRLTLLSQHKYYARLAQLKYVPEATPNFMLINTQQFNKTLFDMPFPVFIKPVKSSFSMLANQVNNLDQLLKTAQQSCLPKKFIEQFNWFLKNYTDYELNQSCVLVERLLEGIQTTFEGLVHDGQVEIIGVVDSIMFPGTISFKRFEYPSSLPDYVQKRMADIAARFVTGIGLNNTLFDIEFMYNPDKDTIHIIEINPRMSPQFADLFEKVDGESTYGYALAIAQGKKPKIKKKKGKYAMAICFVLRVFQNQLIQKVPTKKQIEQVYQLFPDARLYILAHEGNCLSDYIQDGKSFRYGLVHLGGRDRQDLFEKFNRCKQILEFKFIPID